MSATLTVTSEDVVTLVDHGSVVAMTGTAANGDRVTFAGDPRAMENIALALLTDVEDSIEVDVDSWQVLGVEEFAPVG